MPAFAGNLAALAIKTVIGHPGITSAIVSMKSESRVAANLAAAAESPLPSDVLRALWTKHRWVRNFFEPIYWSEDA